MTYTKNKIRKEFIKIRNEIPFTRRAIAEKKAFKKIYSLNFSKILSFAPKTKEINIWNLNKKLAQENKLYLPKTVANELQIYEITNLETQLVKGKFNILEPNPAKCKKVDSIDISCVLVPAIVFDKNNNRLGYGRGFYDRFLKNLTCPILGIGFLEQLSKDMLPTEKHDIKLNHLLLF